MLLKVQPDKQKANALVEMAAITLERLNKSDKEEYPTNTLNDYYDIIHKIMEALVSLEGIKIKGEGAHQELIEYVCKQYVLGEAIRQFLQELRDYRNRISYEGFMIKPEFIKNNRDKIESIITKLKKIFEEKTT
jgi:uncharacterized coiled-coil DUF342 family protein